MTLHVGSKNKITLVKFEGQPKKLKGRQNLININYCVLVLILLPFQNIKADDLAGYLSDVFGGGGGSRKSNSGQVAPGATGKEIGTTTNKSNYRQMTDHSRRE